MDLSLIAAMVLSPFAVWALLVLLWLLRPKGVPGAWSSLIG